MSIKNESGSLLLEALMGAAIATLVILAPLQMYFNSYKNVKSYNQIENGMQLSRLMLNEFRGFLPSDPELVAGDHYRTYDSDGMLLGGKKVDLPTDQQSRVFYETQTNVVDNEQLVNMGTSGSVKILLKQLDIKVTWVINGHDPATEADDEKKTVSLTSVIPGQ